MEFCPKCGSVLMKSGKEMKCVRCRYKSKGKLKIEASEEMKKAPPIGVITDKDTDVFPVISCVCGKCSNKEAYFWTSVSRAGDEAETRFFRCTKCKHIWREYH